MIRIMTDVVLAGTTVPFTIVEKVSAQKQTLYSCISSKYIIHIKTAVFLAGRVANRLCFTNSNVLVAFFGYRRHVLPLTVPCKKAFCCYFYTRAIESNNGDIKTTKFFKGDPALLKLPDDVWETLGKYRLLSRVLRGGISGSGDVLHPANAVFKIKYVLICR
ncbi:uncharacterized protein LOC107267489 isoform X2 [Cephus cinctus]|uniref:Uncharacterized protein LOC107267489 isoform X2 n=1 Tax=Cephus cinctus TaxID=211228 RepID=A0AAJ7BUR6_CEPCN|nr:uncharacterized protein LOC107267489 isoform X2 [Cephus cinctus]